jgi:hypothetical protein
MKNVEKEETPIIKTTAHTHGFPSGYRTPQLPVKEYHTIPATAQTSIAIQGIINPETIQSSLSIG